MQHIHKLLWTYTEPHSIKQSILCCDPMDNAFEVSKINLFATLQNKMLHQKMTILKLKSLQMSKAIIISKEMPISTT